MGIITRIMLPIGHLPGIPHPIGHLPVPLLRTGHLQELRPQHANPIHRHQHVNQPELQLQTGLPHQLIHLHHQTEPLPLHQDQTILHSHPDHPIHIAVVAEVVVMAEEAEEVAVVVAVEVEGKITEWYTVL